MDYPRTRRNKMSIDESSYCLQSFIEFVEKNHVIGHLGLVRIPSCHFDDN